MNERVKECIAYYLNNIYTDQYNEAKNKAYADGEQIHL